MKSKKSKAMNHPGMVSESRIRLLILMNFMDSSNMAAKAGPMAQPNVSMAEK